MNNIPKDIEDLIMDYKQDLEDTEKINQNVISKINDITYIIFKEDYSSLSYYINPNTKIYFRKLFCRSCKCILFKQIETFDILYENEGNFDFSFSVDNYFPLFNELFLKDIKNVYYECDCS